METGCEAMIDWRDPARFRRYVCPLLARRADGQWVCSVDTAQVRPFWGRAFLQFGVAAAVVALLAGGAVYVGLRGIGYDITPRQVFWPRAWHELSDAKVRLFIKQAEDHLQAGRAREALRALIVANQLAPDNYRAAIMLAQLYRVGNPVAADRIYVRMLQVHPEQRNETARLWFTALLAQGRLVDVAELSRRQLVSDPTQSAAWLHALLFSCRQLQQFDLLDEVARDAKIAPAVRSVAQLELRVRKPSGEKVDAAALRAEPIPAEFPYARLHRVQLLSELRLTREAIELLARSTEVVAGRDIVAAALAAYAAGGDTAAVRRETRMLLGGPATGPVEVAIVAVHLVRFPDAQVSAALPGALTRSSATDPAAQYDAVLAVLCALGVAGDKANFEAVLASPGSSRVLTPGASDRMRQFFFAPGGRPRVEALLSSVTALPLDLNYAMLERFKQ